MLPPQVSSLDWDTTDPLGAMTLGKALSHRGYVWWRPQQREWIVLSPTQRGQHETVHKEYQSDPAEPWWTLLECSCPKGRSLDGPCIHKCAVHQHATQLSEYQYYAEG